MTNKRSHANGDAEAASKKNKKAAAATTAQADPRDVIRGIFENPSYGPAPESNATAKEWIEAHGKKFGCFINNAWHHGKGSTYIESSNPATQEKIADVIDASADDVDVAVKAAKKAQTSWGALSGHERARHMYNLVRHIQKHTRILATLESMDNGKTIRESRDADVPLVARWFYYYAGWAQLQEKELPHTKPVGVVAQVIAWNFPLMLLAWKIAPALAMGNTCVLKPAPFTSLTALLFGEICAEAGLPAGVVNIVPGGAVTGSAMADHPDVDKIAFTGSTGVGRILRRRIAGSGKKISLELGGKSPFIVLDPVDLDSAVEGVVNAIWFNQGQVCSAGSRILVQESVAKTFLARLKQRCDKLRLGAPLDKCVDMGPLVDKIQYDRVMTYINGAKADGADVYEANVELPQKGWYVKPTIISNVQPTSVCVREEIFGPVVSVLTFRSVEEAVALANNSPYGLAASIWTENVSLAMEMSILVKAGSVWINSHNLFDAASGFGGFKESGFGRDGGREGLYDYVVPAHNPRKKVKSLKFPNEGCKWTNPTPGMPAILGSEPTALSSGGPSIDRTPKMYIGGAQKRPDGCYSLKVKSPKGVVVGEVGDGNRKDIRDAVEAAHGAKKGWGKRAAFNRAQICYFIAENLHARFDEFAQRIHDQTGRKMDDCKNEVQLSIDRLFDFAAYADKYGGEVQETTLYGLTVKINEPIGVVGIACPDEHPLLAFVSLVAAAVVRGNTVVVVPSAKGALSITDLYQVFDTSDLPGGVVNIVTGDRDLLTRTLAEHRDVDAMWYFGNEQGSANVEYAAADNMKRTWVNYGAEYDFTRSDEGRLNTFLLEATQPKNIWVPMGEHK